MRLRSFFFLVSILIRTAFLSGCDVSTGTANTAIGCPGAISPGAFLITGVMANPIGADMGQEFFEVWIGGVEFADLSGLTLVYRRPDGSGERSYVVAAGTAERGDTLIFGDGTRTGETPQLDVAYGNAFDLRNDGAYLGLFCGEAAIDEVTYPKAQAGMIWRPELPGDVAR